MKDQTRRPAAYWRPQPSKPICSEPGCTRPARIWTRRRSFCTTCAPESALRIAYDQLWELVTAPTTLMLDTTNAQMTHIANSACAGAVGMPVVLAPAGRQDGER